MMRGFVRSILSAMLVNRSARARSWPAAAGISAVSCAIALVPGNSTLATFRLIYRGAQVAAVPFQQLRRVAAVEPEAKQDCGLDVSASLFEIEHCIVFRTADDLPDDDGGPPAQLGIPRL